MNELAKLRGARAILILLLLSALLTPGAAAQDDIPTIGFAGMGDGWPIIVSSMLDVLQAYDFVNSDERATLDSVQDLQGEKINFFWALADSDAADANIAIDAAFDREPDLMVVISSIMAQMALTATQGMDDPSVILFSMPLPYELGMAEARCVKASHVAGTNMVQDFDTVFDTLAIQFPDLNSVGILFAPGDLVSEEGARLAAATANARGIQAYEAPVSELSALPLATDGLISKGVELIIVPVSLTLGPGYGIVTQAAAEADLPVVVSAQMGVVSGPTFGIGQERSVRQGADTGRILAAWLNGDLDIAATGINHIADVGIALNMDSAALVNLEIKDELIAMADGIVVDGSWEVGLDQIREVMPQFADFTDEMMLLLLETMNLPNITVVDKRVRVPLESLMGTSQEAGSGAYEHDPAADAAFIASLQCSAEMIAQQQAELDAAG